MLRDVRLELASRILLSVEYWEFSLVPPVVVFKRKETPQLCGDLVPHKHPREHCEHFYGKNTCDWTLWLSSKCTRMNIKHKKHEKGRQLDSSKESLGLWWVRIRWNSKLRIQKNDYNYVQRTQRGHKFLDEFQENTNSWVKYGSQSSPHYIAVKTLNI